jgi:hypothetical protein
MNKGDISDALIILSGALILLPLIIKVLLQCGEATWTTFRYGGQICSIYGMGIGGSTLEYMIFVGILFWGAGMLINLRWRREST